MCIIWLWSSLLITILNTVAQDCPEYIRTQYDYIIVGAGTAGSVLAARLSEDPRNQVLLLEAGDKETDRPETPFITTPGLAKQLRNSSVDWKYFTHPQENALFGYRNKQAALPRGKVIGGTFAMNDMIYQRGSPGIFDEWDKKGAKGWGFKHVAPYFRKSVDTKVMELSKSDLHRSCGPMTVSTLQPTSLLNVYFNATQSLGYDAINCNEKEDQGICRIQTNIRGGERLTTAKAYLNEARGRQNLNIVTKALVSRVLIARRQAVGIEFIFSNVSFQVLASNEVILSAGSYGSPKILFLSGIGPREQLYNLQIPVIADLPVGENLQDHISVDIRVFVNVSTMKPNSNLDRLMIDQYFYQRKGLMASIGGSEAFLFANTNKTRPSPYPDLQLTFKSTIADHDHKLLRVMNKDDELIKSWYSLGKKKDGITITVKLLHPKSRGHLKLNSTDPNEMPIIDPEYLSNVEDIKTLYEGIKIVKSIIETPIMQSIGATMEPTFKGCKEFKFDSDLYWKCYIQTFSDPGHHPVSTCKMGAFNDVRSVVDNKLRVKDVFNLRVVDASVFPEITDHPNAATIMIAERAAALILK
ncbi:glucose dehydrogenase [FAD, quinone]-like [Mytilus galloprovincialis]|uniref:glucose dehydrogenase [FAD, quinone]-like n=1 Tax=Mytilus galloprovincialis TaxID=29158 RepID=UPI003F7CA9CA